MTPRTTTTPELTLRVIVLGLILSVVMGAANVYLGLKAGMTVSASIPAAVLAMLILRGVLRGGTILEANQVQTAASAGESLAAGIIFTVPAMVMIGAWSNFNMLWTTVIAFTGGLLGILFMIPMRRVFVVSQSSELKFPEGIACASVLKAGDSAGRDAMNVVYGALIGAGFKFAASFFHLFKHTLEGATKLGDRIFYFGGDMSPALVAVGLIVRLNVAVNIFIGGSIAWLIGIPMLGEGGGFETSLDGAWTLWSTKVRYIGVGAMVVGGLLSIWKVRGGLVHAVKDIGSRFGGNQVAPKDDTERDIPAGLILALGGMAIGLIGVTYTYMTGSVAVAIPTTVIMVLMAFFFTAVASYIVGLVGNSNSPVSGMTITAVLFTGVLLYLFGFTGMQGMTATLGVAAIVCCVACTSGDVCNDLKTGAIVGAAPYRQQIMQILGVAVAAFVMAPIMQLLHDNTPGGIGGRELSAPQASLFKSLAEGFFGGGSLPWGLVAVGAVVGIAMIVVDQILVARNSEFRFHVMPIAVGMYLPFGLSTPILIGGLIAHFVGKGAKGEAQDQKLQRGVLFSSGIIAGESLMGVGIALLASAGISRMNLDFGFATVLLTAAAAAATLYAFHKFSQPEAGRRS